jgi:hypothetical protein
MSDACPPEPFEWDGEVMRPLRPRRADAFYTVGERYIMAPVSQRSDATHKHEFAWLREAWMSLPEHLANQPHCASPEHLRKWALIHAGYSDSHTIVCSSKAEALRVAAFLRPIDEFAVVVTQGPTVTRYTAKSQSRRAMGAKEFQESKTKIMEVIARMLGVEPAQLPQQEAA